MGQRHHRHTQRENGIVLFGGISGVVCLSGSARFGCGKHLLSSLSFCFVSFRSARFGSHGWRGGGILAGRLESCVFPSACFLYYLLSPRHVPPVLFVYTVYPPLVVVLVLPTCYHFIESELRMFWIDTTCYVQFTVLHFSRYITFMTDEHPVRGFSSRVVVWSSRVILLYHSLPG